MSMSCRRLGPKVGALIVLACLLGVAGRSDAGALVVEGGGPFSPYFVLSDSSRPYAASGWDLGVTPTIRAEYWWNEHEDWKSVCIRFRQLA